jgi:hypothetical protein
MKKVFLLPSLIGFITLMFFAQGCRLSCGHGGDRSMKITFEDSKQTNLFDKIKGFHKDSINIYYIDAKGTTILVDNPNSTYPKGYNVIDGGSKKNSIVDFSAVGSMVNGKITNIFEFANRKDRDTLISTFDKCEEFIDKIEYNGKDIPFTDGSRRITIVKNY